MWIIISVLALIIGLGVGIYVIPQLSNRDNPMVTEGNPVDQVVGFVDRLVPTPYPTDSATKRPTSTPAPTVSPVQTPTPDLTLTSRQILALIDSGAIPKDEGIRILEERKSPTATPASTAPSRGSDPKRGSAEWVNVLETSIDTLINQERHQARLSSLARDAKLISISKAHSQDMAAYGYFSHTNLKGESPTDRANFADYRCRKNLGGGYFSDGIGENLFQAWTYSSITYFYGIPSHHYMSINALANQVVQGWMDSPGHRENILEGRYDRSGIGVAIGADESVYITQNFC
jgi:uncharacterized protein YkwD